MADLQLFEDAIAEIASRLDLREPNHEAVQTLVAEVSQYYDVDEQQPPFEAVIDSATGVGKTYILSQMPLGVPPPSRIALLATERRSVTPCQRHQCHKKQDCHPWLHHK